MKVDEIKFPSDFKTLTAIRFFAALMIVVYHYFDVFGAGFPSVFYKNFYLGVDFFFILSGFILLHVYYDSIGSGSLNIKNFYLKRLAKIYPVHSMLTVLLFVLIIVAGNFDKASVYSFFSHMLLVHAWGIEPGLNYNSPSWSISAEWFIYLLFPFIAPVFFRFRDHPVFLLFLTAFFFLGIWFLSAISADKPITEWTYHFSVLRIFPEFCLGMSVYNFLKYYKWCKNADYVFMGCLSLLGIFFVFFFHDWIMVFIFALMIYALAGSELNENSIVRRFFSSPFLVFLGEASYCLYMIHFLVLLLLVSFFEPGSSADRFLFVLPIYIAVSIMFSMVMYFYVENPARRWIIKTFVK